jgi:hypothetical protein
VSKREKVSMTHPDPIRELRTLHKVVAELTAQLLRTRKIPLSQAAKFLRKSKPWVRANFKVIVEGPKSHSVKLDDIEAFQKRRTMR